MTGSLDNKLLKDKIWETDLCMNKHRCGSIPRYHRLTSKTSTF